MSHLHPPMAEMASQEIDVHTRGTVACENRAMDTVADLLPRIRALGDREAIRWISGFRTEQASYAELYGRIGACAAYLKERGIGRGDRVLIRAENRPEWVAVFWACVAGGIHAVPVDFRFSAELT